jgi:type I restriction enzyme M protein
MVNIGRNYILDKICEGTEKPNIKTYGQELNEVAYAIAKSEALITESDLDNIRLGDTLIKDHFEQKHFDYQMANPPYGINWSKEKEDVKNESFDPYGRFSAGLPRINDGQLLFLQHMIHHMAPSGGKIGVVTNGSPLFSGAADSGESNIRKWIIENDWLDCIIALPKDMFYNTPISTYIWILSNRKPAERKGKVQLINAVDMCKPLLKSMGNKRNDISGHIDEIYKLYAEFKETENSKIFNNSDFGYLVLTIEQPLRDEKGNLVLKAKKVQPDTKKNVTETVPLNADIESYFQNEVLPHIDGEAWIDYSKTKIGYEINFTRYFYEYQQPETTTEIYQRMTAVNLETGLTPQQTLQQLLNSIFED